MPQFIHMCEFLCVIRPASGIQLPCFRPRSAADADSDRSLRYYKPMIRTAAKRRRLVISYTSITAAAGVHQPHLITARLCPLCRSIKRLTAADIAAEWMHRYQ